MDVDFGGTDVGGGDCEGDVIAFRVDGGGALGPEDCKKGGEREGSVSKTFAGMSKGQPLVELVGAQAVARQKYAGHK